MVFFQTSNFLAWSYYARRELGIIRKYFLKIVLQTYGSVGPWHEHSEGECTQDRPADDAEDSQSCFQDAWQVFHQKDDGVGQNPVAGGQQFCQPNL